MLLSVIIPFYNEEEQVDETIAVTRSVLDSIPDIDYEMILIDDGSRDQTWLHMEAAARGDERLHILGFSRNFGKEAAICAGLDYAGGDAAVLMDGDLQHPPRYIPEMVRLWREEGYEVVDGVKKERQKEALLSRWTANAFYSFFQKLTKYNLKDASDFKLLDRRVIDAWKSLGEYSTFFRGLSAWLGYKRVVLEFEVDDRKHGTSKWNLRSLLKLSIHALTAFSSAPLHIIVVMGMIFWVVALILGVQTVINYALGTSVAGFTTVILLLLVIGGAIMIALGLIGKYVGSIYDEVKHRPRYIVSRDNKEMK